MKKVLLLGLVVLLAVSLPLSCFALGGKVSYPDGSPAVGAIVTLSGHEGEEPVTVTCDALGQFAINEAPMEDTFIKVQAPDGKGFGSAIFPSALFESGSLAVVLPPTQ